MLVWSEGLEEGAEVGRGARLRALVWVPQMRLSLDEEAQLLMLTQELPPTLVANALQVQVVNRGYDAASGKVVWEYDTTDEVTGISGVKGRGGSMGGGGPVVYDGMVYVNSGYGLYFHMPGNLLLAFSVDGK